MPCDLDLGDAASPRRGRGGLRRAGAHAARRARRGRHRPRRLARAARGPRRGRGRHRPLRGARRAAARAAAHAAGARRPRAAHHRRARLRGADARRGPPADGHRLRPAGRRPRLPAARRPRALPGGLRRARGRARARGPPSASTTRRPPCAASWSSTARRTPARRTGRTERCGRLPGVRRRLAVVAAAVAFLLVTLLVARWLTTEGRERDAVTDLLRAQARGDAARCCAGSTAAAPTPAARRPCAPTRAACAAPGAWRSCPTTRPPPTPWARSTGPTRVAWRVVGRGLPVVQCVEVARGGTVLAGRSVTPAPPQRPHRARVALLTRAPGTASRRRARCSHPPHAPPTVPSAPRPRRPRRDAAARVGRRRPVGRVDAERAHALRDRAVGALPARRHLALPPRPRGRRPAQRLAAPDGHRRLEPRERPERLERDGSVGGLVRRRRRLVPPRLPAAERPARARLDRALRVGELPRADLAQRPPDRRAHRRLPALRGHAAGVGAAPRRDEPPGHPRRQPPAGDGLPARRGCRCAGRRSAAGGTTAGSCARSTSAGSTGATSPRCRSSRTSAARPARRGWTTACGSATSAGMPAASPSAGASAAAASPWAAPRSRPAARRPCGGRCACPARGCGRRRRRTSTTPRSTLSVGRPDGAALRAEDGHQVDPRGGRPAAAQRPARAPARGLPARGLAGPGRRRRQRLARPDARLGPGARRDDRPQPLPAAPLLPGAGRPARDPAVVRDPGPVDQVGLPRAPLRAPGRRGRAGHEHRRQRQPPVRGRSGRSPTS